MSEPKKIDRRKFIYAGLGAVALVAIGAAAYVAMNPPVVTKTVTTSTTVPTTSVVTTTQPTTVVTTVPTTSIITSTTSTTVTIPVIDRLSSLSQVGGPGPALEAAYKMWSQKTGIPVDVTAVPGPEGLDRTMAEFVAKSKAYDLMPLFSPWLPSVGMFPEDLKPWVEKYGFDLKIFPQPLLEGATWKGRLVCLPFRQSTTIFYYRKDLYEELRLSVPKTLDELVDNAIALTDPNKNRYGWGMIMTYPGHWVDVVSPLALALGARLLEPPDQTTIAPFDPNGIVFQEIFRAFRKMYEKGCSPAGMTTWTWSECLSGLQSGLIAQSHTVTARVPLLEDPSKSQTAGKWDYVILRDFFKPMGNYPQKSSSLFMWGIAMNQWISDKRKEVAFNALQFVVSREAQLEGLKYANDPCRLDVLNSEEFKKINKAWQLNIKGLNDLYDDARHPKSAEIQKYVVDASHAALLGKKTPEEAAKELWKNVSEALAK